MTGIEARHRAGDGGFTYLEVLVAIAVLAIATTAMASALEQVRMAAADEARAAVAEHLLLDGLAWVRTLPRLDAKSPVFGPEDGEAAEEGGDLKEEPEGDTVVDDVDDLLGLIESAPVDRGGTRHGARWSRRWTIESVPLDAPSGPATTGGSTPLLRVLLAVLHDGHEVATGSLLLARTP